MKMIILVNLSSHYDDDTIMTFATSKKISYNSQDGINLSTCEIHTYSTNSSIKSNSIFFLKMIVIRKEDFHSLFICVLLQS